MIGDGEEVEVVTKLTWKKCTMCCGIGEVVFFFVVGQKRDVVWGLLGLVEVFFVVGQEKDVAWVLGLVEGLTCVKMCVRWGLACMEM